MISRRSLEPSCAQSKSADIDHVIAVMSHRCSRWFSIDKLASGAIKSARENRARPRGKKMLMTVESEMGEEVERKGGGSFDSSEIVSIITRAFPPPPPPTPLTAGRELNDIDEDFRSRIPKIVKCAQI